MTLINGMVKLFFNIYETYTERSLASSNEYKLDTRYFPKKRYIHPHAREGLFELRLGVSHAENSSNEFSLSSLKTRTHLTTVEGGTSHCWQALSQKFGGPLFLENFLWKVIHCFGWARCLASVTSAR